LREIIIRTPQGVTSRLHLPERTRTFIQRAFADGTVERIDEGIKSDKARAKKWERRKWLLVRYLTDEGATYNDLKQYAEVKTSERVRQLYAEAIKTIWKAAPIELQNQFPEEEILKGKRGKRQIKVTIYKRTPEIRAKLRASINRPEIKTMMRDINAGKTLSEATKAKISVANKGRRHSKETKSKIAVSQRERHRRKKRKKKQLAAG
jgi:hypothetical protein